MHGEKDKYPLKLTYQGKPWLALRPDEFSTDKDGSINSLDIWDAHERWYWELSNETLLRMREEFLKETLPKKSPIWCLVNSIDKVLAQRKFMQDNESFRNALIPE